MNDVDRACPNCLGTGHDRLQCAPGGCAACLATGEGVCFECLCILGAASDSEVLRDGHRRCAECDKAYEAHLDAEFDRLAKARDTVRCGPPVFEVA